MRGVWLRARTTPAASLHDESEIDLAIVESDPTIDVGGGVVLMLFISTKSGEGRGASGRGDRAGALFPRQLRSIRITAYKCCFSRMAPRSAVATLRAVASLPLLRLNVCTLNRPTPISPRVTANVASGSWV
jgi:hypothetical protein